MRQIQNEESAPPGISAGCILGGLRMNSLEQEVPTEAVSWLNPITDHTSLQEDKHSLYHQRQTVIWLAIALHF